MDLYMVNLLTWLFKSPRPHLVSIAIFLDGAEYKLAISELLACIPHIEPCDTLSTAGLGVKRLLVSWPGRLLRLEETELDAGWYLSPSHTVPSKHPN